MNKNLEQIRAKNALELAKDLKLTKTESKRAPAMIMENGLLGALAFAQEKGGEKGGEMAKVMEACVAHWQSLTSGELQTGLTDSKVDLKEFSKEICECSAAELRRRTEEIMAFLNYLRRYAKEGKETQGEKK